MRQFILAAIIALPLIAMSCTKNAPDRVNDTKPNIQTWETYHNKRYGYSFRYPASYEISQFEGMGNAVPITAEGSFVRVSDNQNPADIFSIRGGVLESFSEQSIRNYFTNSPPEKVSLNKINIAGETGYKAIAEGQSPDRDYYFVQKANGPVLEITTLKNSATGLSIFSTFSFD